MANLANEQRRIVQMRVALRRLVAAGQPLKKGELFDNPSKAYPEWQRHVINRLIERDVIVVQGEDPFRRAYRLARSVNRSQLRKDLEDDLWISGLIWPKQDFVQAEELMSEPEPKPPSVFANIGTATAGNGKSAEEDLTDSQRLDMLLALFRLAIDKMDRIERKTIAIEKGLENCTRILSQLE